MPADKETQVPPLLSSTYNGVQVILSSRAVLPHPHPRRGRLWPFPPGPSTEALGAPFKHDFCSPLPLAGRGPRRLGWAPAFTFWWLQALGARGLEPSEGPLDHLFVLHLHGLGGVALVVVMARWEQLPRTAAGHLEGNTCRGRASGQARGQTRVPKAGGGAGEGGTLG